MSLSFFFSAQLNGFKYFYQIQGDQKKQKKKKKQNPYIFVEVIMGSVFFFVTLYK